MPQNQSTPPSGNDIANSILFKKFLGKAEGYLRQPTRLKQLLTDAYQKASEKNEVGSLASEAWETLQTLFRLIKSSMSGEYTGVPGTTVAAAVAVLIYFLSPIDLIPDFIPVLGLLDDVALVAWFSGTVKSELEKFHEWETTRPTLAITNSKPTSPATGDYTAQPAPESAKHHGTTDNAASSPNTDAGLGSPDSSSPRPVHEAGPDAQPTGSRAPGDDVARTSNSSRNGNVDATNDTGGNIR